MSPIYVDNIWWEVVYCWRCTKCNHINRELKNPATGQVLFCNNCFEYFNTRKHGKKSNDK